MGIQQTDSLGWRLSAPIVGPLLDLACPDADLPPAQAEVMLLEKATLDRQLSAWCAEGLSTCSTNCT